MRAFYLLMISHFAYGISVLFALFVLLRVLQPPSSQRPSHSARLVSSGTEAKLLTAVVVDFPHFVRFARQQQQ